MGICFEKNENLIMTLSQAHRPQSRARTTDITGFHEALGLGGPFDEAFNLEFSFSTL